MWSSATHVEDEPARLQMGEEFGAVRVNPVQTLVEAILGRHGEIFIEQLVHRDRFVR